jgi:4-diphosphocytidyl-2-C-methyl-D-erythritol kinase
VALAAFAAAKVNLFLHVGPRAADGYHPICSLMVFADVGDRLALTLSGPPRLRIGGPFGGGIGHGDDNLVNRARHLILAAAGAGQPGDFALTLTKNLPVAAGLGGGSSDAAAALRLIDRALDLALPQATLAALALRLGADVPACLAAMPVIARGRGERLEPAPSLPALHAVLANPGVASPTGEVFAAFDRSRSRGAADRPSAPPSFKTTAELAIFLSQCRNDLEPCAASREPHIAQTLELLRAQPETLIARLSGSGATSFALCASPRHARRLACRIGDAKPGWWVAACRLGGPWARGGVDRSTTPPADA